MSSCTKCTFVNEIGSSSCTICHHSFISRSEDYAQRKEKREKREHAEGYFAFALVVLNALDIWDDAEEKAEIYFLTTLVHNRDSNQPVLLKQLFYKSRVIPVSSLMAWGLHDTQYIHLPEPLSFTNSSVIISLYKSRTLLSDIQIAHCEVKLKDLPSHQFEFRIPLLMDLPAASSNPSHKSPHIRLWLRKHIFSSASIDTFEYPPDFSQNSRVFTNEAHPCVLNAHKPLLAM